MPHMLDNIELYLYGHSKINNEDNKNVLLASFKSINDTGRVTIPLLLWQVLLL